MADVLVTGKKISEMDLVSDISGEEKIPTDVAGDKAVSTGQLLTYFSGKGKVNWGNIQGDLSDQVDLVNTFNQQTLQLANHANDHENPHNVSAEQVGLGNVDNTSDMDKPVSDAVQQELAARVKTVNGRFGDIQLVPDDIGYPTLGALDEREKLAMYIIDQSGMNQQTLNNFTRNIEVSPEVFGYTSGDATSAFVAAALYAKNQNIPFVARDPEGYLLTGNVDFFTDTYISKVIMPSDSTYRYISVKSKNIPETLPISSLSGLVEFSKKVSGFPSSAIGRYIKIESSDVLTERNNSGAMQYYYKNTAFRLLDSSGSISPSLDMSISSSSSTATVKVYQEESRISFKVGTIQTTGSSSNHNSFSIERDSVDVSIGNVESASGFRTLLSITGNACNLFSPVIKDAVYSGLGYGVSIGLSCDTNIHGMKASNCTTTLDGRHGANVTVYNSRMDIAGTHWGNNYVFQDCDIDTVTWSGKDVKISGGSLRNYLSMRADVAMCIGRAEISGGTNLYSTSSVITPSSNIVADFFTSPRRLFDEIVVSNVRGYNLNGIYGYSTITTHAADWAPPSYFEVSNVYSPESVNLRPVVLNLTNSVALTSTKKVRISNITAQMVTPFSARGFSKYPSMYGYDVRVVDCGRVYIQCDASTFSRYKLVDSELVAASRINASGSLGPILVSDSIVRHDASVNATQFNIEAKKGFSGCEYQGVFSNTGSVNGATIYSNNCRAVTGSTGYPPLVSYVNDTEFLKQDLVFSYDPPVINANSSVSSPFTVSNVRVGDFVSATFSNYNAGIELQAVVSSVNTITVTMKNTTSSAIDLDAGNIRFRVS
jgi:hypothetical protein